MDSPKIKIKHPSLSKIEDCIPCVNCIEKEYKDKSKPHEKKTHFYVKGHFKEIFDCLHKLEDIKSLTSDYILLDKRAGEMIGLTFHFVGKNRPRVGKVKRIFPRMIAQPIEIKHFNNVMKSMLDEHPNDCRKFQKMTELYNYLLNKVKMWNELAFGKRSASFDHDDVTYGKKVIVIESSSEDDVSETVRIFTDDEEEFFK